MYVPRVGVSDLCRASKPAYVEKKHLLSAVVTLRSVVVAVGCVGLCGCSTSCGPRDWRPVVVVAAKDGESQYLDRVGGVR